MSFITASEFPGRSRFCYLYLFLLMPLLACIVYAERPVEHESAQAYEFARRLIQQDRFQEAEAYLNNELQFLPLTPDRLPFLLLLIDVNLQTHCNDEAIDNIEDAYRWADSERDSVMLGKLQREALFMGRNHRQLNQEQSVENGSVAGDASKEYDGPAITTSFFESDLSMALSDLSLLSGVPILWGLSVQGIVTYDAADQPLEKVLETILLPLGYAFRKTDDRYIVGSTDPEDSAFPMIAVTEIVPLSNIKAMEAVKSLSPVFAQYTTSSTSGNTIYITAPQSLAERIKEDLVAMDEPPVQIAIEVIVAEITKEGSFEMGVDWNLQNQDPEHARSFSTSSPEIGTPSSSLDVVELGTDIAGETVDISVELDALLTSGNAQIRANPRLTTMNGRPASIRLIRDEYFIIQTSSNQYYAQNTLQSVTSGIILEITPYVSFENVITMEVRPQVGDVVGSGTDGLPKINTRAASTTVHVQNGETFTVGGLNLEYEEKQQRKIPLLGDIPFLGYFFRYSQEISRDSEIVIFVTPRILE
ncbi:type II and III secretion system protein [bacterium]|nr:type II and III secretion system protein [bacterium]